MVAPATAAFGMGAEGGAAVLVGASEVSVVVTSIMTVLAAPVVVAMLVVSVYVWAVLLLLLALVVVVEVEVEVEVVVVVAVVVAAVEVAAPAIFAVLAALS